MTGRFTAWAACGLLLGVAAGAAAAPRAIRGIGVDETLDGPAVLAGALRAAKLGPGALPLFARVLVRRAEIVSPAGTEDFALLDARVNEYASLGVPVLLVLGDLPSSPDDSEPWRVFVRAVAERYRASAVAFQLGARIAPAETAAREYAYFVKLGAVQVRSVSPDALVVQASLAVPDAAWQEALYGEDVAAYLDVVAVDAPPVAARVAFDADLARLEAVIAGRDAESGVLVTGCDAGRDAASAGETLIGWHLTHLGQDVTASWTGTPAALAASLARAAALGDVFGGRVVALDERAASLRLLAAGRDVASRVPHRLVYNMTTFATYLVCWRMPAELPAVTVELRVTTSAVPVVRDAIAGRQTPASAVSRDEAARLVRADVARADHPLLVDFNFGATEVYALETQASERKLPTVEEIVFRHQQVQAAQDASLRHYEARARMEQHFRPSAGDSGYDVVSENRFFFEGGAFEWEELSFSVNGTKWGSDRPGFPLLQPEKVLSLPMALRLTRDYTYRLEGMETVGRYRCYVVRFDPVNRAESLYRGRAWIDSETFARVKVQTVQTALRPPMVSNEEVQLFEPVAAPGSPPAFLLAEMSSRQIFLIAGRNLLVERKVTFSDFSLNGAGFAEDRAGARRGPRIMYRDTDAGVRYLVRRGEERVVSDQLTQSAKALAMGTIIQSAFRYPLPILGINYLNFDFTRHDLQLALLFGGVLALGNVQRARLFGAPLDLSVDFFGIAVPTDDQVFDRSGERRDERLATWPLSTGVNVGYQFTDFQKVTASYQFRYDFFRSFEDKPPGYVLPASTITNGIGAGYEYRRAGYSVVVNGAAYRRASWHEWGLNEGYDPRQQRYAKYGASLTKDLFVGAFQKIHLNAAYFGGQRLDRFSMYQFGLFDDTRMRGVPSAGVRFGELAMARAGYSFNLFDQYRLDLFLDRAIARDPADRSHWVGVTGTGFEVNLKGPKRTLLRLGFGKSFLPGIYAGAGSTVVEIMVLKPL